MSHMSMMGSLLGSFSTLWSGKRSRSSSRRRAVMMMMRRNNNIREEEVEKQDQEKEMGFLSVDDFKDTSFDGLSSLDILVEVCGVASQKLEQEKLIKETKNDVMINNNNNNNVMINYKDPHDSVAADQQCDEFEAHTRVDNGLKRKYDGDDCDERDGVSKKKVKMAFVNKTKEEKLMIKKGQIHMYEHEPSSTSNGDGGGGGDYNSSPVSDIMEELGQCFNVARAYPPPVLNYKQHYHQMGMESVNLVQPCNGVLIRSTRVNSTSCGDGEPHRIRIPNNGSKRKYTEVDHDDGEVGPKKKKKKVYMKSNYRKMKKGAGGVVLVNLNKPPAELPGEYKRVIIEKMNGTELRMVIEKELFNTDIIRKYNRLSLPPNQIYSHDFLTEEEMVRLWKSSGLTVPLVDPMLGKEEQICLGLWKLSSNVHKKTYILKTQWNHIVEKNGLVPGDIVQIWSFRTGAAAAAADNHRNHGQLNLALVVKKAQKKPQTPVAEPHRDQGGHRPLVCCC